MNLHKALVNELNCQFQFETMTYALLKLVILSSNSQFIMEFIMETEYFHVNNINMQIRNICGKASNSDLNCLTRSIL